MKLLKILVVALLLGLSLFATVDVSAASWAREPVAARVQPRMSAQIQVGSQDSQIKFWQTNDPQQRQTTIVALSALVTVGVLATWARRRFY